MSHPHQAFLDEFEIAIKHLVPLTPPEIIKEAKDLFAELSDNPDVTEKQIHQALSLIGRKEYPYRKAYEELCQTDEEKRLQSAVFEHLEPEVREKIEELTKFGVVIEEYVKSDLFEEQLEPDERYQVEKAILLADEVLDTQCNQRAEQRKVDYESLVKKHKAFAEQLQKKIDGLRQMGQAEPKWQAEINTTADRLEEGWSVVEQDPREEEVQKEIEYWNTVLNEGEDDDDGGDAEIFA